MKTLQSNFTTPEQSKWLLELGVPADSADCYFGSYGGHPDYVAVRQTEFETEDDALFRLNDNLLPCWSVGRMMEIISECYQVDMPFRYFVRGGMMESLINTFIELKGEMDFSKLED